MSFWKIGYKNKGDKTFEFDYDEFDNYQDALETLEDLKKTNFSDKVEAKIFFVSECSEGIPE
jgi:hypothetical protein